MATENQRVVAYLSHDEMAELKDLSELWGLSLSKTIARAVREVGTLKPTGSATIAGGLSEHEVTTLIDNKVDTLRNELQDSLGKLREGDVLALSNLEKEIAAINSRLDALGSKDEVLPPVVETETLQGIIEGQAVTEKIQEVHAVTDPVEAETLEGMLSKYPDGISQSELGNRFGITQGAVGNQIREAKKASSNDPDRFLKWSRGHEAKLGNDFAWQFKEDRPNLFPVP